MNSSEYYIKEQDDNLVLICYETEDGNTYQIIDVFFNNMSKSHFWKNVKDIKYELSHSELQDLMDNNDLQIDELTHEQIISLLEFLSFISGDSEYNIDKLIAVAINESYCLNDFYTSYGFDYDICGDAIQLDGKEWMVIDDYQADQMMYDYAESYLDDALYEVPDYLRDYFDSEKYIDDYISDCSRGEAIACYDGLEHFVEVGNETLYVYRIG